MAKVIAFPQKNGLPEELKERIYYVGKEYVDILYDALDAYVDDEDDFELAEEVIEKVSMLFKESLDVAIAEMEEEL